MNKYFFLSTIILTILFSCSSVKNKIRDDNFVYGTKLFNKNLGVSVSYFGDMELINLDNQNLNHIKKLISGIKILKNAEIIAFHKTTSEPNYESILFYTINNESLKDGQIINDSQRNFVLYKKSSNKKAVYLFLKSFENLEKTTQAFLHDDATQILNTIKFDNIAHDNITYLDVFNQVQELDNYLIARNRIKNAPVKQNNQERFNQFQFLTTINSFISNNKQYDSLISKNEKRFKEIYQAKTDSLLLKQRKKNNETALQRIIDASKNEKVVMLNEMHWYPKHRVLALKLLEELKKYGFNYLAIEAINSRMDTILNQRGIPSRETGYYTREPYFAHFIRKAINLDFKIVSYDDMEGIKERELAQATNLKKIIDADKNAKIFVYAGIDHILESNPTKKRMAEYFKELSGINPVTFNQAKIIADSANELELFQSSDFNGFNNLKANVDYFIVNNIKPNLKIVYPNKTFKTTVINNNLFKIFKNKELLVDVYDFEEYTKNKKAIPIISTISIPVANQITLNLPEGKYFIAVKSDNNDRFVFKEVVVK